MTDFSTHIKLLKTQGDAALSELADDELMLLSSADRKDAFAVLVERYLGRVTNFCGKYLGNPRLGEEQAQEAFLQAWAHRRKYRADGRFQVFLFTLARNRCRNQARGFLRQERRVVGDGEQAPTVGSPSAALDVLIEQENQRRVRDALRQIPEKLREAILLRYDQELEYPDLARIIGKPEATARSRVFHGIKKLRAALEGGQS